MSQKSTRKLIQEKKRKRQKQLQRMMLIGGGFLLVAGVLFAVLRNSKPPAEIEVTGSPSLKVDQEVVDLNDVTLGNTVQVSFELTNVGDQELRFSEVPTIEVLDGC